MAVLQDITSTIDVAKLIAERDALRAKLATKETLRFKVGDKGGVSVYGLNSRFPVTLYAEQWERLLAKAPDLLAFVKVNGSRR